MPCEELQVGLTANASPTGCLVENSRPESGCICRDFEFGGAEFLVTFDDQIIYSFSGVPMRAF